MAAAAAARRLLSRRASSSSLSALLRRGTAAAAPEQQLLLRPAAVAAASRLVFARGMARRPGGDGFSPARPGGGGDRAPTEMAPLFPGCDYEHWLIVMDKPGGEGATKQQMIDCYVETLAKVLGSVEEAKKKIYNVSCERYFGFGCEIDEETSNKLEGLPGVLFVLPDSYVDPEYKDYGGQYANLFRAQAFSCRSIPVRFHQLIHNAGISTTRNLLADDAMVPISSPLTPPLGDSEETDKKGAVVKRLKVQAIKKDIKQSPKKMNLVAKLVRGMRVEDALLQLQVTVKRAAKTVYQVIHSARANAAHNHGLDPDKLIVEEAFVGKGLYLKRLSYHAKGRSGIMVRPRCRLTVVVREATAEEEAKIAKLRVSNYKKLTRKERQLMPHRLIEVSPRWARKRKEEAGTRA